MLFDIWLGRLKPEPQRPITNELSSCWISFPLLKLASFGFNQRNQLGTIVLVSVKIVGLAPSKAGQSMHINEYIGTSPCVAIAVKIKKEIADVHASDTLC